MSAGLPSRPSTIESRFWDKVDRRNPEECWSWQAATNGKDYGYFKTQGRLVLAHRLSWELANGPIPSGLCVLHCCDNRRCVNPAHLWLGTVIDNNRDMKEKGRARSGISRGRRNGRAKLIQSTVKEIRSLYMEGNYTQQALAMQFDLSPSQIGRIVRRESWRWLE